MDLEALLGDPERKQSFVTPMFDVIAPRYDDFTRLFSFGMDARWKADLLREAQQRLAAGAGGAARVLDLACGTGDLAIGLARGARSQHPDVRVRGVDASGEMTRLARARLGEADRDVADLVSIETGDMSELSTADHSIDLITAGYAVRNAPSPELAIREAARVLRSGGVYVTLDFYRPQWAPWRVLLLGYLAAAGNLVGWTWHRSPVVYGYIARSIDHFMSWQEFSRALDRNGFDVQSVTRWLGGGVAMHVAVRR
jgi:demethylmenaquinone methyltransferase/2-methoxy-6-polyprenyl-1,4-benzoquinol methylase